MATVEEVPDVMLGIIPKGATLSEEFLTSIRNFILDYNNHLDLIGDPAEKQTHMQAVALWIVRKAKLENINPGVAPIAQELEPYDSESKSQSEDDNSGDESGGGGGGRPQSPFPELPLIVNDPKKYKLKPLSVFSYDFSSVLTKEVLASIQKEIDKKLCTQYLDMDGFLRDEEPVKSATFNPFQRRKLLEMFYDITNQPYWNRCKANYAASTDPTKCSQLIVKRADNAANDPSLPSGYRQLFRAWARASGDKVNTTQNAMEKHENLATLFKSYTDMNEKAEAGDLEVLEEYNRVGLKPSRGVGRKTLNRRYIMLKLGIKSDNEIDNTLQHGRLVFVWVQRFGWGFLIHLPNNYISGYCSRRVNNKMETFAEIVHHYLSKYREFTEVTDIELRGLVRQRKGKNCGFTLPQKFPGNIHSAFVQAQFDDDFYDDAFDDDTKMTG